MEAVRKSSQNREMPKSKKNGKNMCQEKMERDL